MELKIKGGKHGVIPPFLLQLQMHQFPFKTFILLLIMSICVCVCKYVHVSVGTHDGQERAPDPRELELLVVVSHLTLVLGTKFGSYERSASALNC